MQKLFIILLILWFASCKKSEDSASDIETKTYEEEQLLGKWVYHQVRLNGKLSDYEHRQGCEKDRFYFNKYPDYKSYQEMISLNSNCAISQTYMDWKLQKDNLTLNFGKLAFKYKILRLDSLHFDVSIRVDYDQDGKPDNVEIYALKEDCNGDVHCM